MKASEKNIRSGKPNQKHILESFKTVLLIVLCVLCAILTYSLISSGGISEEMPSIALNAVGTGTENGAFTSENALMTFTAFSEPELILIGGEGTRYILNAENPGYSKTIEAVNRIMNSLHTADTVYSKAEDNAETRSALSKAQFCVQYPCDHSVSYEALFAGIKDSQLLRNTASYSRLFIADDGETVTVFIPSENGGFIKAECGISSSVLDEVLNEVANFTGAPCGYAYECGADQSRVFGIALDALTVMPKASLAAAEIRCGVPWNFAHGLSFMRHTEFLNELLNTFSFNPNTIRQYTDRYDNLVFVGDGGTLSISAGGIIDYKALGTAGTTKSAADVYTPTDEFMRITDKIFRLCDIDLNNADFSLKFTEVSPQKTDGSEVSLGLDYYVDGNRVITEDGHAIETEISNGVINRLRICVRNIEKTDTMTECGALEPAIEGFAASNPQFGKITDVNLVYNAQNADGSPQHAEWRIEGK